MGYNRETRQWKVERGDTLSGIAAQVYGESQQYRRIVAANSPPIEDANIIQPGWVLEIPNLAQATQAAAPSTQIGTKIATKIGEQKPLNLEQPPVLLVGTKRIEFVSGIQIEYGLNQAVRTMGFSLPYRPEFLPDYQIASEVQFSIGDTKLFDGQIIQIQPELGEGAAIQVQCAHPAYWLQHSAPAGDVQQWNNAPLEQVFSDLLGPFSLAFSYAQNAAAAMKAPYEKLAIGEEQTIWAFMAKLLKEKGLLAQGLSGGGLHIYLPSPNQPIFAAFGREGNYELRPQYNYAALAQYYIGKSNQAPSLVESFFGKSNNNSLRKTVKNPFMQNRTSKIVDAGESDPGKAAEWQLAKDLAAAVQFEISNIPGLVNADGEVWQAGAAVELQNDEIGYPAGTKLQLLIQSVKIEFGETASTSLTLVPIETRTGTLPKHLPFCTKK